MIRVGSTFSLVLIGLAMGVLSLGCTESSAEPAVQKKTQAVQRDRSAGTSRRRAAQPRSKHQTKLPERSLADLLDKPESKPADFKTFEPKPPSEVRRLSSRPVDAAAALAAGIRPLESKHLTLYTDLPLSDSVRELPGVFDLAVSQWCAYFGIEPRLANRWRMHGFLIGDKQRFKESGLLPDDLPAFQHGYAQAGDFWLYEQPSEYYRRHLLLHEGTHGLMYAAFGDCGAPWYMEGMAELLATHAYRDGKLTLGYFPASRDEVPMLGRIRMIRDAREAGRAMPLAAVFAYDSRAHLNNEPYAWCWALATLMNNHPAFRQRFRVLWQHLPSTDFNTIVKNDYAHDWQALNDQWEVFVMSLEHGYDLERAAINFTPGKLLSAEGAKVTVHADRGWQNTGVVLQAGMRYDLRATGRVALAAEPKPWWSEAQGVTIRYHQGRPLGRLLAAIRSPRRAVGQPNAFLAPFSIGAQATIRSAQTGTLYLAINESAAALSDNRGSLEVSIRPAPQIIVPEAN